MLSHATKRTVLRLLSPLDALVLRLNGKSEFPPLHLRWDVGPLRGYERSAAEYRIFLHLFAGLTSDKSVLDIGCGCGQMAQELLNDLGTAGKYEGWDINREAILWCQNHIAHRDSRFSFRHLALSNGLYQPGSGSDASVFTFPIARLFDIILLKSVFTHLLKAEVQNYLSQMPKLLTSKGKTLVSCFLLNAERDQAATAGRTSIVFKPFAEHVAVANPLVPEGIVAYDESAMLDMIARAGLRLSSSPVYGAWAGDASALTHQDLLILERAE